MVMGTILDLVDVLVLHAYTDLLYPVREKRSVPRVRARLLAIEIEDAGEVCVSRSETESN